MIYNFNSVMDVHTADFVLDELLPPWARTNLLLLMMQLDYSNLSKNKAKNYMSPPG